MSALPERYQVQSTQRVNAGMLYYAKQEGRDYIVKEFMSHRFPPEDKLALSPVFVEQNEQTGEFLSYLERLLYTLRSTCRLKTPMNIPQEVFRHGLFVFKSTLKVPDCGIPADQLHERLRPEQIDQLVKSVLLQLEKLADCQFVHCDIKPDNLMVNARSGVYTASVIDYEGGLFTDSPLPRRDINFTPEYASPELLEFDRLRDSEPPDAERLEQAKAFLGTASDVFSLGLVYHLYLTGALPGQHGEGYRPVIAGNEIRHNIPLPLMDLHPVRHAVLTLMLAGLPDARPGPRQLLDLLNQAQTGGLMASLAEPYAALGQATPLHEGLSARFRLLEMDGARRLVRHLRRDWLPLSASGTPLPAWRHQIEAADRRHRRRDEARPAVDAAAREGRQVLPFEVKMRGGLAFALSPLPAGEPLSFETLRERMADTASRDRLMCAMLSAVGQFHAQGLMHGGLSADSFLWLSGAEGVDTYFHDAPALFQADSLPPREDFDLDLLTLAPETAYYLGRQWGPAPARTFIGTASDIFSLGMVYHALLTGSYPSAAPEPYVFFTASRGLPGLGLSDALDPARKAIIAAMMGFRPADRPADCQAVIHMIENLGGDAADTD